MPSKGAVRTPSPPEGERVGVRGRPQLPKTLAVNGGESVGDTVTTAQPPGTP